MRRYGGDEDTYVKEARKFLKEFEKGAVQYEAFTAYTAKNYLKSFELGRPALKTDPENFFVLGVLSEAGYENALAGNATLNDETIDYLRRAIKLLEGGKITKADPFKSIDAANGFLNLALGWFLKDKAPVEAAAAFAKAVRPKSPYENDPSAYYRLGFTILKGEFAQLSAEYNEKFGSKPPSPEQQAMFDRHQSVRRARSRRLCAGRGFERSQTSGAGFKSGISRQGAGAVNRALQEFPQQLRRGPERVDFGRAL